MYMVSESLETAYLKGIQLQRYEGLGSRYIFTIKKEC